MTTHTVGVRLSDEEYKSLLERVAYLQKQRPGSKVTMSDAVRQALSVALIYDKENNSSPVS